MTLLYSMFANHQLRHEASNKRAVHLVITEGHFNLVQGFVWVHNGLTYSLYHSLGYIFYPLLHGMQLPNL